jgi:presenilin-like A22 family membrane protease
LPDSQVSKRKVSPEPIIGSCLLLIIGLAILFFYLYPQIHEFVDSNQITVPQNTSVWPIVIYFVAVVIVMGIVLALVPMSVLKVLLRLIFTLLYAWGIFVLLGTLLPLWATCVISLAAALAWFFFPLVWLQNILLLLTLVSIGTVFGQVVPPWTVVWVLLAISIYDVVAVFAGYMMWMAKKLSESDTLPAFVLPKKLKDWNLNLKGSTVNKLFDDENAERDFSLLGGGDIGFPLIFVASVIAAYGVSEALGVAIGALVGVLLAYVLQIFVMKGKPLPALPPICLVAFLAFITVHYVI